MDRVASARAAILEALAPGQATRREFMAMSGSALGGLWLMGVLQACESAASDAVRAAAEGSPFQAFTDREGADFEAFAARIIPTDDTPGATEAGVVHFADQALGSFFQPLMPAVRPGLEDLVERARAEDPSVERFADLPEASQVRILTAVESENAAFFGVARLLVVLGFSSNPEYGGNRDKVGWQVFGFQDEFRFQPPFGAYDQDVHGSAE